MSKLIIGLASLSLLAGCTYHTMDACEAATGTVCHMTLGGDYAKGPGIPVDSPAGQALLGGILAGGGFYHPTPVQPYVLPMPQAPVRTGFTCSTLGSDLLHTVNCY